jgi:hypothetical protein
VFASLSVAVLLDHVAATNPILLALQGLWERPAERYGST